MKAPKPSLKPKPEKLAVIAKILIALAGMAAGLATMAALEPHDASLAALVAGYLGRNVSEPLAGADM